MKTVKARKKVKIFFEYVMKTVFYVKRAPLNSNVGFLTLPLASIEAIPKKHLCYSLYMWEILQSLVKGTGSH